MHGLSCIKGGGAYGWVFIDINSKQGPNILGRDAFYLAIFPDGVLDVGGATVDCRKNGLCGGEGDTLKDIRGTAIVNPAVTNIQEANVSGKF